MANNYLKLEWDTAFFGFKVARISSLDMDASGLTSALQELKSEEYRLVYWSVPSEQQDLARIALAHGGFLADEKVTFVKGLSGKGLVLPQSPYTVIPYPYDSPDTELVKLALQSGEYSRFRLDPLFPDELFEKLYACWITRSVSKEIAWEVLVVRDAATVLGLITLGTKGERGDIGLVAVSEHARGKGIGKLLVGEADKRFAEREFSISQVVTQRVNTGACRLYESCGYHMDKIEKVFHFWL
jgi:dTDP-4-amino-4,6-dideoxy-D-galactose acyltransferase